METHDKQKERVELAGISWTETQLQQYYEAADTLENTTNIPPGYKKCGKCNKIKKYYLFNKNNASKQCCSGSCKDCQKETALQSYAKNKKKRNYKKYYAQNREKKLAHSKKYYIANKDRLNETHKAYLQTNKGKKVMRKAHAKRKKAMKENTGIPWTKEHIIKRDTDETGLPLCILCNTHIQTEEKIHMEHLIPIVMGGANCFTNVGCAHEHCNLTKSKDGHEITLCQIETLKEKSIKYIEKYPEYFNKNDA